MTTEQLIKLLILVKSVRIERWSIVNKLHESILAGSAKVISKEWCDQFKKDHSQHFNLDLTRISTWSTYENCVGATFYMEDQQLMCEATIWDGDNLNGYRINKRFEATIQLPIEFLITISNDIEYAFNRFLSDSFDEHLQNKRVAWINNLKKQILE